MTQTQFVRLLIMFDTHDMTLDDLPLRNLPSADVILHCGDLTDNGEPGKLRAMLDMISSMAADVKLVIAGNHDASLDRDWYLSQGGSINDYNNSIEVIRQAQQKDPGLRVLDEGTHTITLPSGHTFTIYASPYSPAFGVSAFQYPSADDRYSHEKEERPDWAISATTSTSIISEGVDVVMTHGPPKYMLDRPVDNHAAASGCEHLMRAIARTKPQLHAFGHIHCGYGIQRVEWSDTDMDRLPAEFIGKNSAMKKGYATLGRRSAEDLVDANRGGSHGQTVFVNAALTDSQGEPAHVPWLIDLEL